jgi:hypothetical protein
MRADADVATATAINAIAFMTHTYIDAITAAFTSAASAFYSIVVCIVDTRLYLVLWMCGFRCNRKTHHQHIR